MGPVPHCRRRRADRAVHRPGPLTRRLSLDGRADPSTGLPPGHHTFRPTPHFYDSLTLFSPARYCALPGLPFPGDQGRYPHRDEAAAYLRQYAEHFGLAVRTGSRVATVRTQPDGLDVELTGGESLTARAVIAATGLFGAPQVPAVPGLADYTGQLLHAAAYRRPQAYIGKRIVVVGGGNSAIQIAVELAHVARVSLATRSPLRVRRQRPLGVDLHHWLHYSRIDRLPLGRRAAASVGVLDDGRYTAALAAGRPEQRAMFTTLSDDGVRWPDGTYERVDAIILGTGYRPALDFLPVAAYGPDGWPANRRGVSTTVSGLGYVGLPGQTGVASAMLRGVGPDAAHVVRQLQRQLATGHRGPVDVPVASGEG